MTLKIRSRSQTPNQFPSMSKYYMHAYISVNLVISAGDIEHKTTFWSKFSMSLSVVILKIRSWSQSPNYDFSMSKCYIHANFGENQVIGSGHIEHNITFLNKFSAFCRQ